MAMTEKRAPQPVVSSWKKTEEVAGHTYLYAAENQSYCSFIL